MENPDHIAFGRGRSHSKKYYPHPSLATKIALSAAPCWYDKDLFSFGSDRKYAGFSRKPVFTAFRQEGFVPYALVGLWAQEVTLIVEKQTPLAHEETSTEEQNMRRTVITK